MLKKEIDKIMQIGYLENKPSTAKDAIALTMVYHIELQIKKSADKEIKKKRKGNILKI